MYQMRPEKVEEHFDGYYSIIYAISKVNGGVVSIKKLT